MDGILLLTQQASLPVRREFSMSWKLQFLTAPSLVVALFPVADLTMCQAKICPPAIFGLHTDLDSELLWSELSGITARHQGFSALMYPLSLTRMGKPGWRSKQGHDGHPSLFCPSDQMLSQSLFSSCFSR